MNDYLSRPKANAIGWSDDRHAEAMGLLRDAAIVVVNGKQVRIVPETRADAEQKLSDFLIKVKSPAAPMKGES